jgi:hypothetical protein
LGKPRTGPKQPRNIPLRNGFPLTARSGAQCKFRHPPQTEAVA